MTGKQPVYRGSDNEHVGYVEPTAERWRALTIFGGELSDHISRDDAVTTVVARGLASLTEKWWFYSQADRRWRRVQLVEVSPNSVRGQSSPYPQSDKVSISGAELATLTQNLPGDTDSEPDYGFFGD